MDIDPSKFHRIFDAITENIFYKDTKGRYMLCTHVCSMINASGDPNFTISSAKPTPISCPIRNWAKDF